MTASTLVASFFQCSHENGELPFFVHVIGDEHKILQDSKWMAAGEREEGIDLGRGGCLIVH